MKRKIKPIQKNALKQRSKCLYGYLVAFFYCTLTSGFVSAATKEFKTDVLRVAQQTTITGRVSDQTGPLPGATVVVKGSNTFTTTDFDGNFSIEAKIGDILQVSYVGYDAKEVTVDKDNLIVVLSEGNQLSEVVVTGYSSQSKRDVTGAVATVDAEELTSIPSTTFAQQLQGRASGVSVVNDATPGGEATVRIRGFGTIGNNNPLYVIDGVPSESQSNLNPDDIESMQILKDASAASIYGSRAANGVIVITTKKGKLGKPSIKYSTFYGMQSTAEDVKALNAKDLGTYLYLADLYAGKTPSNGQYSYGPNGEVSIPDYVFPSGAMEGDPGTDPSLYSLVDGNIYAITRSADTNWWKEVTRTAPILNHNISASGATESSRYAMSLGYFKQEAVTKFLGYERISLRVNTEFKTLNNKLTLGENFSVSFDKKKGGFKNNEEQNAVSGSYKHHPLLPIYDIMGNFAGSRGANLGNNSNPYATIYRQQDNRRYRVRAFGNAYISFDFTDALQFKSSLGIDANTERIRELNRSNPEYVEGSFVNSSVSRSNYQYQWVWTNQLSYNKTFNDVHKVNAFIAVESIEQFGENFGARRNTYAFETNSILSYLDLGDAATSTNYGNEKSDYALFSEFGQVNYSYDDKYLAQFVIRNDASSRFQQASRSAVFPAFSLGWRVAGEDWFKNAVPFVDDFKFRYGWGQTGNQSIGDYNAYTTYRSDILHAGYPIDGSTGSSRLGFDAQKFGNPNAKWETTTSNNFGVDLNMLQNRLQFSLDVYKLVTTDMLFAVPITFSAGDASAPSFNVGQMSNKGFDLSLSWGDEHGDFGYSIGGNLSAYKNNVDYLSESEDSRLFGYTSRVPALTVSQAGSPISSFYGFKTEGLFQSQQEADAWPKNGDYNAPGKFKVADINGDNVIDDADRTIIGSPHPDFVYGITLNVHYKNFDLNVFGNGSQGNEVYNYTRYFADFNTFQGNKSQRALFEAWQPSNPLAPKSQWVAANPNATTPIMDANDQVSSRPSSYFIEDASYFRLKNIQLTYSLDKRALESIGLSGAQIYIQAQNMVTWTEYTGLNPEIQVGTDDDPTIGFDGGYMPVYKTVALGLNINLY